MGPELLTLLILVTVASAIITGGVFVHSGNKPDENGSKKPVFVLIGWIIIGTTITLSLAGIIALGALTSSILTLFLFAMPLIILCGLIFTFAYGLASLVKGYTKDANGCFNKGRLIAGWTCVAINIAMVVMLIIVISLFTTGVISISFM